MANVICELPKKLLFLSGQDTKIRFSLEPYAGDPSFNQWKDAMKMVARLPEGVPIEFRKKVSVYFSPLYLLSMVFIVLVEICTRHTPHTRHHFS